MNALPLILLSAFLLAPQPAHAAAPEPCQGRSEEIKAIADADQRDRQSGHWSEKEWSEVERRDRERRERVAAIFADGCFKTAADYRNAALVFQHGSAPDHFFQTYLWSRRAVELGDKNAVEMAALGLDRYLEYTGRKQIYASQARVLPETDGCNCLWPVEDSSTDEDRRKHRRPPLADALSWVDQLNAGKPSCRHGLVCPVDAKPVPRGSLPGVDW